MKLDSFLETVLSKWRYRKAIDFIRDKKVILEIGCGAKALFLRSLTKSNDKKLIGIDPRADENIPLSANFVLIKKKVIDKIDLTDNSIEGTIMLAVLEHLDKPQEIINEIYRLLTPGGMLCLTTPTPFAKNILEFLAFLGLLDREQVAEHKNYFNREKLEEMARQAGFAKTKHHYFQLGCNNFFVAYKQ